MSVIPKTKDQVDQWRSVMFLYDSALKKLNTKIEILNNEFVNRYDHNPIEHIKSRLKTADSIVKKLKKDGYEVTIENMMDHLSDIAGIRIICSFTSDIYQIADMIAAQGDITVLHVKDYIQNPKPNGYKSYHMVVTVPVYLADGPVQTKVEIQIRSVAMDFWASLEHKIAYKFEGNAPEGLLRELKECADVVDMLDKKMFSLNEAITAYAKEHPEADYSGLGENFIGYLNTEKAQEILKNNIKDIIESSGSVEVSKEELQQLIKDIMTGFQKYVQEKGYTDMTKLDEYLTEYLQTEECQQILTAWAEKNIHINGDVNITKEQLEKLSKELLEGYEAYVQENGYPDPAKMGEYLSLIHIYEPTRPY